MPALNDMLRASDAAITEAKLLLARAQNLAVVVQNAVRNPTKKALLGAAMRTDEAITQNGAVLARLRDLRHNANYAFRNEAKDDR